MEIIKVFYSWQSDLPRDTNNNGIRLCIKESCLNIEKENSDIQFIFDEATRDVPGSPNIPDTILDKINSCDIFVVDITTINSNGNSSRKVANPNVLIELGYAIGIIGWDRIILLFNENFGQFPEDLPFDIDRQRTLKYKIVDKDDRSGKGQLTKNLNIGIKLILDKNPTKLVEKRLTSPDNKKRLNDIKTLESLFTSIHLTTMDEFIENLPDRIPNRIFFFWAEYEAKVNSSYFYIYNKELNKLILSLKNTWGGILSFGHRYNYNDRSENHIFITQMDVFSDDQQKDYDQLLKLRKQMFNNYRDLIKTIREKWIEVDIEQCSNTAIRKYIDYHEDIFEKYKD